MLVRHLLSERVREKESHVGDLALEREQCESRVASAQEMWKDMRGEALEESNRLRVELMRTAQQCAQVYALKLQ